jgi:hypothetical protein
LAAFRERLTPALGLDDSSTPGVVAKPAIVFRKRKAANQDATRKRDEADN